MDTIDLHFTEDNKAEIEFRARSQMDRSAQRVRSGKLQFIERRAEAIRYGASALLIFILGKPGNPVREPELAMLDTDRVPQLSYSFSLIRIRQLTADVIDDICRVLGLSADEGLSDDIVSELANAMEMISGDDAGMHDQSPRQSPNEIALAEVKFENFLRLKKGLFEGASNSGL